MGWSPGLMTKEKVSWAPAFISLFPNCGCMWPVVSHYCPHASSAMRDWAPSNREPWSPLLSEVAFIRIFFITVVREETNTASMCWIHRDITALERNVTMITPLMKMAAKLHCSFSIWHRTHSYYNAWSILILLTQCVIRCQVLEVFSTREGVPEQVNHVSNGFVFFFWFTMSHP